MSAFPQPAVAKGNLAPFAALLPGLFLFHPPFNIQAAAPYFEPGCPAAFFQISVDPGENEIIKQCGTSDQRDFDQAKLAQVLGIA